jgi:hypothetical protein
MQYAAATTSSLPPQRAGADVDAGRLVGFLATSERYLLHSRIVIDDRGRPCIEPCDDDSFAERREACVRIGVLRAAALHVMRSGTRHPGTCLR